MVEVDIGVARLPDDVAEKTTALQQIDEAYRACKFGKFHIKLILRAFFGTVSGVLVSNTTSYILPVAECDLNMDLLDKGMLNAVPFIGMTVSSVVAGFLTDTFGRKRFLVMGFGGIFFFSIIAGTSQTYAVLLTAKFFEGLLFSVSIGAHVTFIPEFCYKGIRDRVMICQSSFVAITQIISPLMAWGILTQDWKVSLFSGFIVLNTWNLYLYIMSLWSFCAFILYLTVPESPKYLLTQKKYAEAREILIRMYKENTGKPEETYPYIDIWKSIDEKEHENENCHKSFARMLVEGLRNVVPIFKTPLVIYLAIISSSSFVILAIYNIARLWYPQVSAIVEHNQLNATQDLCALLDGYTRELKTRTMNNVTEVCVPHKSGSETYINSIIIGTVCLIPYFITGGVVNIIGKKALLVISGLTSVGVTLGMRWANSKVAVVALFAVDTALAQLMKGLNQVVAVELFPTTVRTLAVSLILTAGRLGTLVGNIGFPLLLDMGCVVPFFTMAGMMMSVVVLTLLMPKNKY